MNARTWRYNSHRHLLTWYKFKNCKQFINYRKGYRTSTNVTLIELSKFGYTYMR